MDVKINEPVLIQILKENRDRLNSMYAFIRRMKMDLNQEAFIRFLAHTVQGLTGSLKNREKPLLEKMVLELYEKGLELTARGLLGSKGKHPHFEDCLDRLMACFPDIVLVSPGEFLACISNAIINITEAMDEKVVSWTDLLCKMPGKPADLPGLQKAGLVAAWRLGLAAYRQMALEYCRELDPALFAQFFSLDDKAIDEKQKQKLIREMKKNPWINLSGSGEQKKILITTAGGFTGFGGTFTSPPEVFRIADGLVAAGNEHYFRIYADIYGCTLVPLDDDQAINSIQENDQHLVLTETGEIGYKEELYPMDKKYAVPAASWASDGSTLCFTSGISHKVFIIGISG